MRIALPVPRWAVSFADLGLVLIACFVMLNAMQAARPKADAGTRAESEARPGRVLSATQMFEPGEARLTPAALTELRAEGRRWAGRPIRIVSRGAAEGNARLERFELAAARSAAAARALRDSGVRENDIELRVEQADGGAGQTLAILPR
ncbi:flagellar motor protein MotB [Sphingosinicella sp. LHD-64]|uniref:flagellar motor protein MotB n=1 Tax=Sphingosinicella sp. LHD-64 TaxID=3072139 RepID=UPI00280EF649|nr:flagellar motor protein MotB [Sphingosinicella sp. LHD-64]MDQ8757181.1 flagellar motor protein MotB [Sphingosinicella sp. LHD-64]